MDSPTNALSMRNVVGEIRDRQCLRIGQLRVGSRIFDEGCRNGLAFYGCEIVGNLLARMNNLCVCVMYKRIPKSLRRLHGPEFIAIQRIQNVTIVRIRFFLMLSVTGRATQATCPSQAAKATWSMA